VTETTGTDRAGGMRRDWSGLDRQTVDVLVVGGGIHGAAAARECARRGLSTVLVEQGDFGHATSANSLKIMHGGLRYLQHLNLARMRDSIRARREMLRLAPHYVRPLACVIPNAGFGVRSNLFMRVALWANDLVGWDRNRGLAPADRLPQGRILSRRRFSEIVPGTIAESCSGASLWYDALAVNSERLTLTFVQAAVAAGAWVFNHAALEEVRFTGGRVSEARIRDLMDGREYVLSVRAVVNAAGPWQERVDRAAGITGDATGWPGPSISS